MKLKSAIATFLVILTGTCIVPFLTPYMEGDNKSTNVSVQKPQIETNQTTNTTQIATNKVDRALDNNKPAQNMDWFIQGSNYIWDGWKIK